MVLGCRGARWRNRIGPIAEPRIVFLQLGPGLLRTSQVARLEVTGQGLEIGPNGLEVQRRETTPGRRGGRNGASMMVVMMVVTMRPTQGLPQRSERGLRPGDITGF